MTRFRAFAAIGVIGWGLQVMALSTLIGLGVHYVAATFIAVELAIVHNFVWHERYTWRDRRATSPTAVATRLLRFNASTALVSVLGNVVITAFAVEHLHLPAVVANTAAVCLLSVVNYAAARLWVFTTVPVRVSDTRTRTPVPGPAR
jgi:dolichol-phosphate mannosyltransferase